MKKYRIVKQTDVNELVKYRIESQCESGVWVLITYRSSLDMAKHAIEYIKSQEIVSSEVVYEC